MDEEVATQLGKLIQQVMQEAPEAVLIKEVKTSFSNEHIKSNFLWNLVLALKFPQLPIKNELVKYFLPRFQTPSACAEIEEIKKRLCKLPPSQINGFFNMNCFYAAHFDDCITPTWTDFVRIKTSTGVTNLDELTHEKYCRMVEKVQEDRGRAELHFPRFFEFFLNLIAVDELFMERREKKGLDAIHLVRYKEIVNNDSAPRISNELIRQTSGVDLRNATVEYFQKRRKGIGERVTDDEPTQIQVHDIFDEELVRISKEELVNLTPFNRLENAWETSKNVKALTRKVIRKGKKKFTGYGITSDTRKQLRKQGKSKEEIRERTKMLERNFDNLKRPVPIVLTDRENDDVSIPAQYIPIPPEQAEVISRIQTREVVRAILMEWKRKQRKQAHAARAFVDDILDNMDDADFSNRQVALRTGVHEDVIGRIRKRFEKELPILRKLLQ